ncbi:MAG: chromate transporter [Lentisphaeria bacterium]|nr:chromate transporter [Lentisphaeria bacterium]
MNLLTLFLLFVKYGFLSFGGGYVLVPMLMADLVEQRHLMAGEEFARLLAVAQITPGPIGINTATYIGFRHCGIMGGLVGTAGLLVPALVLVVAAMYFLRKYENTLWLRGALQGLRPAAFGLVVSAAWIFLVLAATSGTWGTADFSIRLLPGIMAVAVLILQLRTKIPFLWLMVICGILGAFFCR